MLAPVLPGFSSAEPLFLIAGPCAIESEDMVMECAERLQTVCGRLGVPLIFKSSYDKANRTDYRSARGLGREKGLAVLERVRQSLSLPVLTDVHLPQEVAEVASVVDVLQIPAFLCRQTDLIVACAVTGHPVQVKKGQFMAPWHMRHIVNKVHYAGGQQVLLCERGSVFGYNDLVVDMRSLVWLRQLGCPVVFDATHSVQQPGDEKTLGLRDMVPPLARAACAVGVDGLFIETHPQPQKAISDAATQWPLAEMESLLRSLLDINRAVTA